MTPITFTGYGVNAPDPTIIVEQISYWYRIEYNGIPGTTIELLNGKAIMKQIAEGPTTPMLNKDWRV